jgi:hypothetical protein
MEHRPRRALIVLNVCLLGVLGVVTLAPSATAQRQGNRARGEYTMVAGEIQGGSAAVIYVVDTANEEMVALRWAESAKALEGIGYRDLQADASAQPGR